MHKTRLLSVLQTKERREIFTMELNVVESILYAMIVFTVNMILITTVQCAKGATVALLLSHLMHGTNSQIEHMIRMAVLMI